MDVQERNGHKIYDLTHSSTPSSTTTSSSTTTVTTSAPWLSDHTKRAHLKRDAKFQRRIELLQDFYFPCSSYKIRQSPNGQYIHAVGMYKPRLKCYDLDELSLKFERFLDAEPVDFCFLSEDYGKLAILTNDRGLNFHAPYGLHHGIRLPSFGRALAYDCESCHVVVPSRSGEVFRFDLEGGMFASPWNSGNNHCNSNNNGGTCVDISKTHALTAVGFQDGCLRLFDARVGSGSSSTHNNHYKKKKQGDAMVTVHVSNHTSHHSFHNHHNNNLHYTPSTQHHELTSVAFDPKGMHLAAGTHDGCVALYDLRSPKPLHVKAHSYGLPIHTLGFHRAGGRSGSGGGGSSGNLVMSCDEKLMKFWFMDASGNTTTTSTTTTPPQDTTTTTNNNNSFTSGKQLGQVALNIEGKANLHHVTFAGDTLDPTGSQSGLLLGASEQSQMQLYYCPYLGRAPRWCSFLDGITEELEEGPTNTTTSTSMSSYYGGDATAAEGDVATTLSNANSIYQDYKFLTLAELESLGVSNLIGTPLLRGYMHGYFMDAALHAKLHAVAKPFEYERYRKELVRKKVEERRGGRIAPRRRDLLQKKMKEKEEGGEEGGDFKVVVEEAKVNQELAQQLLQKAQPPPLPTTTNNTPSTSANKKKRTKDKQAQVIAQQVLQDDRFKALFDNPDMQVDPESEEYGLRNAGLGGKDKTARRYEESDEDDEEEDSEGEGEEDYGDDHEEDKVKKEGLQMDVQNDEYTSSDYDNNEEEEEEEAVPLPSTRRTNDSKKQKRDSYYSYSSSDEEDQDNTNTNTHNNYDEEEEEDDQAFELGLGLPHAKTQARQRRKQFALPLEQRLAAKAQQRQQQQQDKHGKNNAMTGVGGRRQVTFTPKDAQRRTHHDTEEEEEEEEQEQERYEEVGEGENRWTKKKQKQKEKKQKKMKKREKRRRSADDLGRR